MSNVIPGRARTADLIVEHLGDETLVFDRVDDSAHCLSPVAALVWELCDGETGVEQIIDRVAALDAGDADQLVERALADLTDRKLLMAAPVSRRGAIARMAKVGAGALSVPLVLSVTAPTAAWAGSVTTYNVCTNSGAADGGCALNTDICTLGLHGTGTTKYCNPDKNCEGQGSPFVGSGGCGGGSTGTPGAACCSKRCNGSVCL